jgi:hypothetical protein
MDACVLQLDASFFRIALFRVTKDGAVESVPLGGEPVTLGESISRSGSIGRRARLSALAAATRLVALARKARRNAHVVVIASEALALARNAEAFFDAMKRRIGATPRFSIPSGVVLPLAIETSRRGLVLSPEIPHVHTNPLGATALAPGRRPLHHLPSKEKRHEHRGHLRPASRPR